MTIDVGNYKKLAAQARIRRDKQLPDEYRIPTDKLPGLDVKDVSGFAQESGLMDSVELEITGSDIPTLLKNIADNQWSALSVTKAFCKRAAYAQQLTNCLSEILFDRGIERAKYLDDYHKREGKVVGPLHGLPVSIKDHHMIKGATTGVGFTSWSIDVATEDAAFIELLYDLGAVVYCKTTVPVAMMMPDTESHTFGLTTNPKNRSHSAGGSSGGEAALISFGGSAIGIGSDVGGSVRVSNRHFIYP